MPRLSLAHTIFAATAGAVAGMLLITLAVTSVSARRSAERSLDRGLGVTNARIVEQLKGRQADLIGRASVLAQDRFLMTNIQRDTVGADAWDQAKRIAAATGARWVQITDAAGVRIAKSDEQGAERIDLSAVPLVTGALEGRTTGGFGVSGDSAVLQLVAVPLLDDLNDARSVVATIMVASAVGDSLAAAIGAATGSEVAFYVIDGAGKPQIAGTTMALASRAGLRDRVAEQMMSDRPDGSAAAATGGSDSAASRSMLGNAGNRTSVDIDGREFVGQATALLSAAGAPVGGFVALRSLDGELAGYYALRRTLLVTGLLGLLTAFALSGAIAGRIVRPVTALAGAARRAADGDYAAEIPLSGQKEIATLADAFRRLLADLRDKQALFEFLDRGGAMSTAMTASAAGGGVTMPMMTPTAVAAGALVPGQSLGARYDIKSLLGAGGMGMVYRAVDRELQEVVAIKTLKPELIAADATALDRFKSEIRLARKISHRNVVRTHDLGEAQGQYFITMEFVEGTSLRDLVRERGRLPVNVMLPIAKQLCRALEMAHEAGVIHRDIKPHNMVVERDGTLKVMDFGIARLATRAPSQGLTEAGMVVGTPEYMSPEQLLGDELDARADLYSAGVVMYECLTGRLPFDAPSPMVLIARVLEETPQAPHLLHDDIPPAFGSLVMRVMARDRDARPASAQALHDALEQVG